MNPPATVAARNNADWCAAVCRTHGIRGTFGPAAWTSARRTPPYYPDAVTLRGDARATDILPRIDTTRGCSVKDSFATLDLAAEGFVPLLTAEWIHRPAGRLVEPTPEPRVELVRTAEELVAWQAFWHGQPEPAEPSEPTEPPDVFRPALLADPAIRVVAMHRADDLAGGAVLSLGAGAVGVSNLFAVPGADLAGIWSAAITAAADHFPGLPLVGYQQGDDLRPALACGFTVLGPLRVWLRH